MLRYIYMEQMHKVYYFVQIYIHPVSSVKNGEIINAVIAYLFGYPFAPFPLWVTYLHTQKYIHFLS